MVGIVKFSDSLLSLDLGPEPMRVAAIPSEQPVKSVREEELTKAN